MRYAYVNEKRCVEIIIRQFSLEDVQPVIDLFVEDSGGEVSAYIDGNRLFISGVGNEVMIRFNKPLSRISIARIEFINQRQGYGTRLIQWLIAYGKEQGFLMLEVEGLLTSEIHSFVQKHGFRRKQNGTPPEILGDWEFSLTDE